MAQNLVQLRFDNYESFSESIRSYDLEIIQLGGGSFSAGMGHVSCDAVSIYRFDGNVPLEANGAPPAGFLTFGIPTVRCESFVWRHLPSLGNTIQIYKPHTELAMFTHSFFQAIDVSISQSEMEKLIRIWELPDLDDILENREMAICRPREMGALRARLNTIFRLLEARPERLAGDSEVQNMVTCQVPRLIVDALLSSRKPRIKLTAAHRERALRNAIDYIRGSVDDNLTVESVCGEIGVGIRTLQRAFRNKLDMSPKTYLTAQRLNRVYRDLLQSRPETGRITEVATNHGFWHMGQFAADYKRLFGELPSATLARSSSIIGISLAD